jgi:hypothetical protein
VSHYSIRAREPSRRRSAPRGPRHERIVKALPRVDLKPQASVYSPLRGEGRHMERWEFDHSEEPRGWRWLRVDTETLYVRRCCDRYFDTLRECVEDAVVHGYEVPVRQPRRAPRDYET